MRNIQLARSTVQKIVETAVKKRYHQNLSTFLYSIDNGTVRVTFPGSEDLVELTKIFRE